MCACISKLYLAISAMCFHPSMGKLGIVDICVGQLLAFPQYPVVRNKFALNPHISKIEGSQLEHKLPHY